MAPWSTVVYSFEHRMMINNKKIIIIIIIIITIIIIIITIIIITIIIIIIIFTQVVEGVMAVEHVEQTIVREWIITLKNDTR